MTRSLSCLLLGIVVLATGCRAVVGEVPPVDGGVLASDASIDAGVRADAGATADAGETTDAATAADAGYPWGDAGAPIAPTNPVAGLPSPIGPTIARIAAMNDGEWLKLGSPAADPKYGTAAGRSWGGRAFAYAPDLRAAFFTGEGVHAYVKPNGLAMDDVWAYDINAHRWIAVYPGTEVAPFNDRVRAGWYHIDADGQLRDSFGQHVPVHTLIHSWDLLTYDTDARRFATLGNDGLGRYYLPGEPQMDEGLKLLDLQRPATSKPMSPWYFDVPTGRFTRTVANRPRPNVDGFPFFQYLSFWKKYVALGEAGVALFDPMTGTWADVQDTGPRPPGYDHGGTYDSKRKRIYMGVGNGVVNGAQAIYIYDLELARWSTPPTTGEIPGNFSTAYASAMYDEKNDVMTVVHTYGRKVFVYHPVTAEWTNAPIPDEVLNLVPYATYSAFYDPVLNVVFLFSAGDSGDNGVMWAYRYKK